MLATTPPPVKPRSRICAVVAVAGLTKCVAPGQPYKRGFLSGTIAKEELVLNCGVVLGIERRTGSDFPALRNPKVLFRESA